MLRICLPLLFALIAITILVVSINAKSTIPRVIVDIDPGVDDLEALTFLINAERQSELKLDAIVVTEGNTNYTNGIRNVYLLLKVLNKLDVPVYLGGKQPLLQHDTPMGDYYGTDGLGDLPWKTQAPVELLRKERAFEGIRKIVCKHPQEITYITLGPMTTLGVTIWMYPEVATHLKEVYSMGGLNYQGAAEFNVGFDPESVDIVFRSIQSKMLMITWEAGETNSPKTDWYKNVTHVQNPAWQFIIKVNDGINKLLFGDDISVQPWNHCDPIVPIVLLYPSLVKSSFVSPLQIEVGRNPLRGVVTNSTQNTLPIEVVTEIDYDVFLDIYVKAFNDVCKEQKCQNVD